jgi:hypothetical protein
MQLMMLNGFSVKILTNRRLADQAEKEKALGQWLREIKKELGVCNGVALTPMSCPLFNDPSIVCQE